MEIGSIIENDRGDNEWSSRLGGFLVDYVG